MIRLLASLLLLLTLATAAVAQQTITLYFDANYGGAQITLPLPPTGTLSFPPAFNDQVTSIRWNLLANNVLTFYENSNLTGREYCVTHDQPRVGGVGNVGSYYNDKLSSVRWGFVNSAQGWVRFYTDTQRGGYQLTRYLSSLAGNEIPLISLGYNDQVDSLEWNLPPDRTVMCYDEFPAGGKALPLIGAGVHMRFIGSAFNTFHDCLSTCMVMNGSYTAALADRDRPIDQVCQLGSHNSHANSDDGWVSSYQQHESIPEQLAYGVRGIDITVREENGVYLMVRGSVSQSTAERAGVYPDTLDSGLTSIRIFLNANPREVIFLRIRNRTGAAIPVFGGWLNSHPLASKFYYPTQLHWPSINELVAMGKQVVVLNDGVPSVPQLYPWTWQVENGDNSLWNTQRLAESDPIDSRQRSLFCMNNFSATSTVSTWGGNSPNDYAPLLAHALSFAQTPNLVAIDGVEMADHAGLEVCRTINQTRWATLPSATAYRFWHPCGSATLLKNDTAPKLGTNYRVQGAPFHALVIGFSDQQANGVPLPTPVPGITVCNLRTSLDLLTIGNGQGFSTIAIPASGQLLGTQFFGQAAELTGSNWPLSNGVAARIGL